MQILFQEDDASFCCHGRCSGQEVAANRRCQHRLLPRHPLTDTLPLACRLWHLQPVGHPWDQCHQNINPSLQSTSLWSTSMMSFLLCSCVCDYAGNNAVEMQTTATFLRDSDEFEIHTPTTLAQKYWITNSAVHAKFAVVFGQLLIGSTNHGVHGLLVRIRHDVSFCSTPQTPFPINLTGYQPARLWSHQGLDIYEIFEPVGCWMFSAGPTESSVWSWPSRCSKFGWFLS